MSIKYSEILTDNQILSAGDDDIIVIAIVDGISSSGYTTKAIKKSNLIPDPLFTSLTTTGTTGASTLVAGVLNIPEYGGGIVDSVTGLNTDNTDPANPIVALSTDGITITGTGTLADPLVAVSSGGTVQSVTGLNTDNADPANPIIQLSVGTGLSGTGTLADPLINAANVYESVAGDSGTATATGLADTLTVSGGKGITTDATVADTVSIVADVAKDTSGATTIAGLATVTFTHNLNTFFHSVVVTDATAPYTHFIHGTDYSVSSPNVNDVDITSLTGGGMGNVRVTVIG